MSEQRQPLVEAATLRCNTHGTYRAWRTDTPCPRCVSERLDAEELRERQLNSSNLRGRFRECTFDSFEATELRQRAVLEACRSFAETFGDEDGGGLWLIGPVGTGKSHLGAAMVRAARFDRNMSAVLMTAREMVRDLRATWRRDSSVSEEDRIEDLGRRSLLVLDEIGVGFGSDAEQVQLFDVLDLRYQLKRPTVLLSNLNLPALKMALGDRAFDRLREASRVLICDWASYRRPLA